MKISEINEQMQSVLNEGAGAAVTFCFDEKDRNYRGDCEFDFEGTTILVKHLRIQDYYYEGIAEDGGKIEFDKEEMIDSLVKDYTENYGADISKEKIKDIEIVGVQELPNLSYSWGWSRVPLNGDEVLTWEKENHGQYLPELQVDVYYTDGTMEMLYVYVDGKYYPSDEVVAVYNSLGDEDDEEDYEEEDFEESVNEEVIEDTVLGKTTTKQQAIKKIYKIDHSGIYNDEGWQGVHDLVHAIEELGADVTIVPSNSNHYSQGYPTDGSMSCKSYDITIKFINALGKEITIQGSIVCSGCGSVEFPLERYDVVMMLG